MQPRTDRTGSGGGASGADAEGWAGDLGEKWLRALDQQEALLTPIGERLLHAAAIRPGERVLEIGPGGGWLARRLAEAVGRAGAVVGLEISPALLQEAERRGRDYPQLRFVPGDAASTTPPGAPFDRLISRFGVMFFADPPVGFRHLASLLKTGGRFDFAAWADPRRNLWVAEVREIMARYVELPTPDPRAPGQFQLADPEFLDAAVLGGGFVDYSRQLIEEPMRLGDPGATAAQIAETMLQSMAYGDLVAPLAAEERRQLHRDLEMLFTEYLTAAGAEMPAAWWLVSSRKRG